MSLDNKQSGDKWFAFELNNVLKQIRQIVLNLMTLNNRIIHWEYIDSEAYSNSTSGSSVNDTVTMPENAEYAVINFLASGGQPQMEGQMIISRSGVVSSKRRDGALYSGSNWRQVRASLSGDTITITHSYSGSTTLVISGTVYYYT